MKDHSPVVHTWRTEINELRSLLETALQEVQELYGEVADTPAEAPMRAAEHKLQLVLQRLENLRRA